VIEVGKAEWWSEDAVRASSFLKLANTVFPGNSTNSDLIFLMDELTTMAAERSPMAPHTERMLYCYYSAPWVVELKSQWGDSS